VDDFEQFLRINKSPSHNRVNRGRKSPRYSVGEKKLKSRQEAPLLERIFSA